MIKAVFKSFAYSLITSFILVANQAMGSSFTMPSPSEFDEANAYVKALRYDDTYTLAYKKDILSSIMNFYYTSEISGADSFFQSQKPGNDSIPAIISELFDNTFSTYPVLGESTDSIGTKFVGLLYGANNARGVGFQVDKCHVLSASHVVGNIGNKVSYVPERSEESTISGTVIASGSGEAFKRMNIITVQRDWAVIRLAHNFPLKVEIELGSNSLSDRDEVQKVVLAGKLKTVGYFEDLDCRLFRVDLGGSLKHSCFGMKGTSGSPIYYGDNEKVRIIGIHSMQYLESAQRTTLLGASDAVYLTYRKDFFGRSALREIEEAISSDLCR